LSLYLDLFPLSFCLTKIHPVDNFIPMEPFSVRMWELKMRKPFQKKDIQNPLQGARNWEDNISSVVIEPCPKTEDPIGYKAIFYLTFEAARKTQKKTFEIGASFLAQRRHSLSKAGYKVPMTILAIEKIESATGQPLPMFLGQSAPAQYA